MFNFQFNPELSIKFDKKTEIYHIQYPSEWNNTQLKALLTELDNNKLKFKITVKKHAVLIPSFNEDKNLYK